MSRFGNISPELKRLAMAGMHMALPDAVDGQTAIHRGEDVREREWFVASTIGTATARRYNQVGAFAEP
jgi:hypothetical protein